jgi:hypothetical protein
MPVTVTVAAPAVRLDPPSFLTAMVADAPVPGWTAAETMSNEDVVVALLTRLYTDALTTPPTPSTAAMMMNRSMLCEIAVRFRLIFIEEEGFAGF